MFLYIAYYFQHAQWSAVQNQTYWAAARFLAKVKHDSKQKTQQQAKATSKNNKCKTSVDSSASSAANKKTKTAGPSSESRAQGDQWLEEVMATPVGLDANHAVFDTCPQVVRKIQQCFQEHPGVTKASFCRIALQGCNNNALAKFLAAPHAEQQGNAVYRRAYVFLEKLRIHQGHPKSAERLQNERDQGPQGFSTKPYREPQHFILVADECPHEANRELQRLIGKMRRQEKVD